jgi:trans-aconitate 2-methyltransferase
LYPAPPESLPGRCLETALPTTADRSNDLLLPARPQPTGDWNPDLYMKFEDERMLAARDLLARVPLASAGVVYDLGCGPGNSAELLSRRFADAEITGLDTSEAMLAHARARLPRVRFVKQDIADWVPAERPHLIFANAALHFLPDHHKLFPRLAATLATGGAFAAQMPSPGRESSHALMRMVAAEGPWSSRLVPIAKTQPMIASFEDYYEWLRPVASRIDMWMTTYVHALEGPEGIADWFAGSALQPFLERLSDDERCLFLARYREGLRDAYPAQSDGKILLAYPRLFIVAIRK